MQARFSAVRHVLAAARGSTKMSSNLVRYQCGLSAQCADRCNPMTNVKTPFCLRLKGPEEVYADAKMTQQQMTRSVQVKISQNVTHSRCWSHVFDQDWRYRWFQEARDVSHHECGCHIFDHWCCRSLDMLKNVAEVATYSSV